MIRPFLLGAVLLACTACVPVVNDRGYMPDKTAIQSIAVGKDTKLTIKQRLGDPSTAATFNNDVWYYISSHEQQMAFFDSTVQSREILAVEFNKDGQVADIHHYGLQDGNVVDFVSRETPTKGRELTLLQQLFNSTPGQSLPPESSPGGQPGGPGGPGPY